MNIGEEIVKELLKQSSRNIAIFGGGFKPPTKGHFEVAKLALENHPNIDELIISVGTGVRNGVTQDQSVAIWEIYKNYLPNSKKVTIKASLSSPIRDAKKLAKNQPEDNIIWILGTREGNAEDEQDVINRTADIDKYPNLTADVITTADEVSGTKARQALNISKEEFFKFLPDEIKDEKEGVYNILTKTQTQERFVPGPILHELKSKYIQDFIKEDIEIWGILPEYKIDLNNVYDYKNENEFFTFYDDINKVNIIVKLKTLPSNTVEFKFYPIRGNEVLGFSKLKDFNPKIMNTVFTIFQNEILPNYDNIVIQPAGYTRYRLFRAMINNHLDKSKYEVKLKDDIESPLILISKNIEESAKLKKYNTRKQISELYNIPFKTNILLETFTPQKAPLMGRFVDYTCDRLNIDKPKVFVINSPTYSQEHKSFGGYYPQEQEIKVVVHNRNMADILRTLAHELVHHMQNLNGDELNGEDGSNTENEANALAGIIMREFGRENPEIFE